MAACSRWPRRGRRPPSPSDGTSAPPPPQARRPSEEPPDSRQPYPCDGYLALSVPLAHRPLGDFAHDGLRELRDDLPGNLLDDLTRGLAQGLAELRLTAIRGSGRHWLRAEVERHLLRGGRRGDLLLHPVAPDRRVGRRREAEGV